MYNYPRLLSEKNIMTKMTFFFLFVISMIFLFACFGRVLAPISDSPYYKYILQTLMAFFVFLVPALVFAFLYHNHGETTFGYLSQNKRPSLLLVVLGVSVSLLAIPLINGLSSLNKMVWPEDAARVAKNIAMLTEGDSSFLFIRLLVVAVIPAVTEEMFFRGFLQNCLSKQVGAVRAICISALVFSLAHDDLSGVLPRFLLGCFLGYLLARSGSLWLPIIVHFFNNAVIVTCYFYFFDSEIGDCFIGQWGSDSVLVALISAVAVAGCVYLIQKYSNRTSQSEPV